MAHLARRVPVATMAAMLGLIDAVTCSVEQANRDPAIFDRPDRFDPARQQRPSLTFGSGLRPCPGERQALMLAAGVVDAVRERCVLLAGEPVDYAPSAALRIPQHVWVLPK